MRKEFHCPRIHVKIPKYGKRRTCCKLIFLFTDEADSDILSTIENNHIRELYEGMKFMDWVYVCFKARDDILKHFSVLNKPVTHPSPVGLRKLKLDINVNSSELEERVGYRCPMKPILHVYLIDPETVGTVMVIVA